MGTELHLRVESLDDKSELMLKQMGCGFISTFPGYIGDIEGHSFSLTDKTIKIYTYCTYTTLESIINYLIKQTTNIDVKMICDFDDEVHTYWVKDEDIYKTTSEYRRPE